jgi:integrase
MSNYSDILHEYIKNLDGDETLLKPFIALMEKQSKFKPITLFDGLSLYKQNNSPNYSYRINNPEWGLNIRRSCKTPDLNGAKTVALNVWNRYAVMKEFDLIKQEGITFIDFAEKFVIPPLEAIAAKLILERDECAVPQVRKQLQQKLNGINKRINHLRDKCGYLHDMLIVDLRLKHFEGFALDTLEDEVISLDTFGNYMTVIRLVLDAAVSEGVITSKPDTTISKQVKDRFNKKQKREYLEDEEVATIFKELDAAILLNKQNRTTSKTSKYSIGKLNKLVSYRHYLNFILYTGTRSGDECFLIKWSDFSVVNMEKDGKVVYDYYCDILGGKIESQRGGRKILISKGTETSPVFKECLSPLAKMQGYSGVKDAVLSGSDGYIFAVDTRDVQRYVQAKWKIFSLAFTPYQFRHTYITNRIIKTIDPIDLIAKQCGNSVEQIQKTYNHATVLRYREIELYS